MRQGTIEDPDRPVVLKIGTASLVTAGELDSAKADGLCDMVAEAVAEDVWPVLVTSGAIALGKARNAALNMPLPAAQQAAAAIGQGLLYSALESRFAERGLRTGQFLLTPFDLIEHRGGDGIREALNLMRTLGFIPIVNENDVLGVRNNDVLAAILSVYLKAGLLLLLTNVPGLYDDDPGLGTPRRVLETVCGLAEAESVAAASTGDGGTGGMLMKLNACWIATHGGIRAVIAEASQPSVLAAAYRGESVGTLFHPRPVEGKIPDIGQLWSAFRASPRGSVICAPAGLSTVMHGRALRRDQVLVVQGAFDAGDVVDILGPDNRLVGRGTVRYGCTVIETSCPPGSALFISSDYVRIPEVHLCL